MSSRADVLAQRDVLAAVRDKVAELVKQGKSEDEVLAAHLTAPYDATVLDGIAQYYDAGTVVRYRNSDAFIKQLYAFLKPKS